MVTGSIWKYPLLAIDEQLVVFPRGAQALSAQFQNDTLCLWARVDPRARRVQRTVIVVGTGQQTPVDLDEYEYVGTAQLRGLVFHVFIQPDRGLGLDR